MSITLAQCDLLLSEFNRLKAKLLLLKSGLLATRTLLLAALSVMTDDLLNGINGLISGLSVPVIDVDDLTSNLSTALLECPALASVLPADVVNAVNRGEEVASLPSGLENKMRKTLIANQQTQMQNLLGVSSDASMRAVKSYEDALQKAKISNLMSRVNQLEQCLDTLCGSITEGDKIHNSYRSDLDLTSNYGVDLYAIASAVGLSGLSLTNAYSSYSNKLDI